MRPRRRTVAVVVIGVLVLVAGLVVFLVGSTQADDSMADLARATDARSVDRQAAVAGRELDRQVEDALVDARLFARPVDPAVRRALADSRAHRGRLGEMLANIDQAAAAMRADDSSAYNVSVDRNNQLIDESAALWRVVNTSTGVVSQHLAQLYAAYDEALQDAGR